MCLHLLISGFLLIKVFLKLFLTHGVQILLIGYRGHLEAIPHPALIVVVVLVAFNQVMQFIKGFACFVIAFVLEVPEE